MRKFCLYIICLFVFIEYSFGQGELQEHKTTNFNERTYAIDLNSNGYGANFTYGKRLDGFKRATITIFLCEIKHPKEIRTSNPYFDNRKKFIFGKVNNFYLLKLGFGIHKIIFDKFDKGGIGIGYHIQFGPNLGILKPIYYDVLYPTSNPTEFILETEQFSNSIHSVSDIYGRSSYFEGMEHSKIHLGGFARLAIDFDFGERDMYANRLECGIQIDGFLKPMEIMANEKNTRLYFGIFIGYRFGKILQTKLNKQS